MTNGGSQNKSQKKFSKTLVITVILTCFGSSMQYGYNMAVLNLPVENIKCFLNETILNVPCKDAYNTSSPTFNSSLINNIQQGKLDADFFYAQTNTVYVIAGIIGAFSSGWIADLIGRKNGLIFNHIFVIIGAIINGLTVKTKVAALLFVGRFFIGINSGLTVPLATIYLIEIAPMAYRGAIGACHQLAVTLGIVFSYILTMTHTLNTETLWPVACACAAIPAIISLFLLPLCPESPRYIFLTQPNEDLAKREFIRLHKVEDADEFIKELKEEVEISKTEQKFRFCQLFTHKDLRMPLIIACLIQVMQQLSGINAVISYSSSMLETADIPAAYNQYCVILIGIFNVFCTLIALPLLEKYGRRTLLLWPSVLLAICLLSLTITVNMVNAPGLLTENNKKVVGGISTFVIMLYIGGYAFGLGPVPALIVAEIFRQESRGAGYSVSQGVEWTAILIVVFSFPNMNKAIGGYSFLIYFVFVIICWVFFYFYMPETKNRTFDNIARDLAFGSSKETRSSNISVDEKSPIIRDKLIDVDL